MTSRIRYRHIRPTPHSRNANDQLDVQFAQKRAARFQFNYLQIPHEICRYRMRLLWYTAFDPETRRLAPRWSPIDFLIYCRPPSDQNFNFEALTSGVLDRG